MADLGSQAALLADVDAKVTTNGANENTGARVNENLHNIVDTLWNHAGIAGVDVGTCLFVNSTTGDDATGVRGRMDKMYETLDAAYAASVAGDVIVIFDAGTYTFNNDVTKDLNIYAPLATINPQGGGSSSLLLAVNDLNVTIECNVFDGPIEQGSGVTGGALTMTVQECRGDVIAETVYINGGWFANRVICSHGFINSATIDYDVLQIQTGRVDNSGVGIVRIESGSYVEFRNTYIYSIQPLSDPCAAILVGGSIVIPPNVSDVYYSHQGTLGIPPLLTAFFSTSTTDADPGDNQFRFDSIAFGSTTKIYLSVTDSNGNDITAYLDSLTGGQLEMRTLDYSKRILFDVSTVDTASAYHRKINVTPVLGSTPVDGEFYTFDFREAGGSTPQTLADTLIEGQETSGRSIIISEFDGINFEQGVNQVRLKAPATATGSRAQTLQDKDGVVALVSDIPLTDSIGGLIEVAADKSYTVESYASYGYTINRLLASTSSGTCNITVKINGTNVTNLVSKAISSGGGGGYASGANTVNEGDRVTILVDTNSTALDLEYTMKVTRT